jgi:hypothetical protein
MPLSAEFRFDQNCAQLKSAISCPLDPECKNVNRLRGFVPEAGTFAIVHESLMAAVPFHTLPYSVKFREGRFAEAVAVPMRGT